MSNRTKLVLATMVTLIPSVAFADLAQVKSSISSVTDIVVGTLPRLFFGLALVYFLWGLGNYVMSVDAKTKDEAKMKIVYGVIILFVMSSIWGLVNFLQSATGVNPGTSQQTPTIQ